jgi:beta-lactamase regulating signal transducer with metallopeptidase domain
MIVSPDFLNALAWSLVHFLWQGAAIAALAAVVMIVFKSPQARYLIGIGALALMLTSFAVTFGVLRGSTGNGAEMSPLLPAHVAATAWMPDDSAPLSSVEMPVAAERDFLWVARAWLVGVFALALRIAFGLLVLEQLRRRRLVELPEPLVARCRALQRRVGIRRIIRYCECQVVRVPAVIGFFRPIVLIPVRALTGLSQEQLEAVVAHELGHIKRFDVAVNFIQVITETLFFFHPAVWWLNKRIRADREDCCDDVAVAMSGGSVGLARALATMASWRDAPRFAMAATGSPLAARVARLLGARDYDTGARTARLFTASLVLATALIGGAVSLGVTIPAQAQASPAEPVVAPEPVASPEPTAPVAPPVKTSKPAPAPRPVARPKPVPAPNPASPVQPPQPTQPPQPASSANSYIEDMKSVGFDNLDVDNLIAMHAHGITPDFVRGMRATGLNPDLDQLVAMAVHDVTPAYVKQVRDMGFKPDANEIIAMKVQDISSEYVKDMRTLGVLGGADQLIAMKVHDVTPAYVKEMRSAGLNPDTDELIAMKVHDITLEYREELEEVGYKMEISELIEAKVMDITPEFVEEARKHGFKNLSIQKLIQLKNADVF